MTYQTCVRREWHGDDSKQERFGATDDYGLGSGLGLARDMCRGREFEREHLVKLKNEICSLFLLVSHGIAGPVAHFPSEGVDKGPGGGPFPPACDAPAPLHPLDGAAGA